MDNLQMKIDRGVSWLRRQQSNDSGGWHSGTYGALRGGASLTSLVLYTAAHLPEQYRGNAAWKAGLVFLLKGKSEHNCIACPDGTLDYPTYSTAMTLVATRRLGLSIIASRRAKLVSYLVDAQLTEAKGFSPERVDYGGWDLIGASGAKGITSGTNVSVSFHAVEAIANEEHEKKMQTMRLARDWCLRCQNWKTPAADGTTASDSESLDGGFFFHPERHALGNKAQWTDKRYRVPRSYGTATCDGVSLLMTTQDAADEKRVQAGIDWLVGQEQVDRVPGFEDAAEELGWDKGLKFYFFLGLSRILPYFPKSSREDCEKQLAEVLLKLQNDDGSWENESARMREDDPLIATCFALAALSNLARL